MQLEYTFTVIEDGTVPLANSVTTANYFGYAVTGVILISIVLFVFLYCIWFREHQRRIERLKEALKEYEDVIELHVVFSSCFRPRQLLQMEKKIEQRLAEHFLFEDTNV